MSETSQGPGWWQASDGKWYPPEAHPDQSPATPPTPAEPPAAATPPTPAEPPAAVEPPAPVEPPTADLPPPAPAEQFNPNATQVIQRPVLPPTDDAAAGAAAPAAPQVPPAPGAPPPAPPAPVAPPGPPGPPPGAGGPPPGPPPGPGGPPPGPPPGPGGPPPMAGTPLGGPPIPGGPITSGPGGPGGAPPAKKGGAGKIILILIVLVVVVALIGGGLFFFLGKKQSVADVTAETGIATTNTDNANPPQKDLSLADGQLKCGAQGDQLTASGSLTNRSGSTSDYDITVEFRQNGTPFSSGQTKVNNVAAGASQDWSVSVSANVNGQFACRVVAVSRFNAGSTSPN